MPPNDDWLYGQAQGTLLAQVRPAVSTPVTAFVASMRTEVTRIRVCSVSTGNRTFRIYHNDSGGGFTDDNALWYDYPCNSSSVFDWGSGAMNAGISIKPGGVIGIRSDLTSGLTFSFYGVSQAKGR